MEVGTIDLDPHDTKGETKITLGDEGVVVLRSWDVEEVRVRSAVLDSVAIDDGVEVEGEVITVGEYHLQVGIRAADTGRIGDRDTLMSLVTDGGEGPVVGARFGWGWDAALHGARPMAVRAADLNPLDSVDGNTGRPVGVGFEVEDVLTGPVHGCTIDDVVEVEGELITVGQAEADVDVVGLGGRLVGWVVNDQGIAGRSVVFPVKGEDVGSPIGRAVPRAIVVVATVVAAVATIAILGGQGTVVTVGAEVGIAGRAGAGDIVGGQGSVASGQGMAATIVGGAGIDSRAAAVSVGVVTVFADASDCTTTITAEAQSVEITSTVGSGAQVHKGNLLRAVVAIVAWASVSRIARAENVVSAVGGAGCVGITATVAIPG